MTILAISGSLRPASSNTALLRAIEKLAQDIFTFQWYEDLITIPPFIPETPNEAAPETVQALRRQMKQADGIMICTPEYAAGVPGVLKNALDWIVSSGEFTNKPLAAISASPGMGGGSIALHALVPTLRIMGATTPDELTLSVPLVKTKMDAAGNISNPELLAAVNQLLRTFAKVIQTQQTILQQTGELS